MGTHDFLRGDKCTGERSKVERNRHQAHADKKPLWQPEDWYDQQTANGVNSKNVSIPDQKHVYDPNA